MPDELAAELNALRVCTLVGELLATLYYVSSQNSSVIHLARVGEKPLAPTLAREHKFWETHLPWRRLLDVEPDEVVSLATERYAGADAATLPLGLFGLLLALDGCAQQEDRDALAKTLHGHHKVRVATVTQAYHILPKRPSVISRRIGCLPPKHRFRDAGTRDQRLQDYLQHLIFATVPASREFRLVVPNIRLRRMLEDAGDNLLIGVFALLRETEFEFASTGGDAKRVHYNFTGIQNEDDVWAEIERVLCGFRDEAESVGAAAIAVLPELTVTPSLEAKIATWLRTEDPQDVVLLVVAGSFHRQDVAPGDIPVNASPVLQFDGKRAHGTDATGRRTTWLHTKMNAFRVTKQNLDDLRGLGDVARFRGFLALFSEEAEEGVERIWAGRELLLFDLPLGRAAVVICLDYLAEDEVRMLQDLGVDLVFAPAMSHKTTAFHGTNRRVGTYCRATAFCANSAWIVPDGGEEKGTSYVYLPMKQGRYCHHGNARQGPCCFARVACGGLILDVASIKMDADE